MKPLINWSNLIKPLQTTQTPPIRIPSTASFWQNSTPSMTRLDFLIFLLLQPFYILTFSQVGAAISMTYITGQPIVFIGTGQTYADLKTINVNAVVSILMKWVWHFLSNVYIFKYYMMGKVTENFILLCEKKIKKENLWENLFISWLIIRLKDKPIFFQLEMTNLIGWNARTWEITC